MDQSLSMLARLERDVLDDSVALASILRQVLIMGAHASSAPLRTWAQQELKGYSDPAGEVPAYRKVPAQLKADMFAGSGHFKGQDISPRDLPETVKGVGNEVTIAWGVHEIQATTGSREGEHIRLGATNMAQVARLMTRDQRQRQGNPFLVVTSVYWSVSRATLEGILDQIRTRLTEFVAELRSALPNGEEEPTSEQVQRAFTSIHITVGDNSPVTVSAPVAYAEQDATATVPAGDPLELPR
ncbi:AbiTii domain-containing protein [Streptomyces microflavus]|uniref:AbiTii domain-containing protein n=1 Tax=Streptomyces microflavus TaxID=1919 RepID=A0A7H8N0S7_STRMI|nr:hypothetical protein [Streptomyces microflavus]QKW47923.1 hypothetical protein HUT09_36020 [Streptomyces microflavus]